MNHYDETRGRQEREVEILRGLGERPSTADMRAMGDELAYAALSDGTHMDCPECRRRLRCDEMGDYSCRCGWLDEAARKRRAEIDALNAELSN